ncbi:hypothetical protein D5S17_02685 [Pseudonocardiaceae bacterium YIM PH 21723]|nr:hypothetical protein D5S17_02685 [Pseudonocardiaceae bacterium YIM PH 21723]
MTAPTYDLSAIAPARVLVLPLESGQCHYRSIADRVAPWSTAEHLVDPDTTMVVIGVCDGSMQLGELGSFIQELGMRGVLVELVQVAEYEDVQMAETEITRLVTAQMDRLGIDPQDTLIDISGAEPLVGMALSRLAARRRIRCCLLANGAGHQIDPWML